MKISNIIGLIADRIVNEVFIAYKEKLLAESITYIVPAVWGAKKDGELTATQKEMNSKIAPVIKEIFEALQLKDLSGAQGFAIGFIIRGLIISRITYMIEGINNRTNEMLDHIEPLGTA